MKRRYLVPSIVSFLILLVFTTTTDAQNPNDLTVPLDFNAHSFIWMYDNQTLIFANSSVARDASGSPIILDHDVWRTFNTATQTLSEPQTEWPLQPALTPEELARFQPRDNVLPSPDGNLLAFARDGWLYFANRKTRETFKTPFASTEQVFFTEAGLKGFWSADGTAFLYPEGSAEAPTVTFYHIRFNPHDLRATVLTPFTDVMIDGAVYDTFDTDVTANRMFDLSANGNRVLLVASRQPADSYDTPHPFLTVWYPEQSDQSFVITTYSGADICNAAFTYSDESQVVMSMVDGRLLVYDLTSNITTVLRTDLPTYCGYVSIFSYDGAWLTLFDVGSNKLRFLNIAGLVKEAGAI